MSDDPDHWQHLIKGLRAGENSSVREFCDRYGGIMRPVADKHLSPKVKRRVEADDVVQSVFRTFFRRAKVGQFQLPDSDSLWRLLCAITLTKVREQGASRAGPNADWGARFPSNRRIPATARVSG